MKNVHSTENQAIGLMYTDMKCVGRVGGEGVMTRITKKSAMMITIRFN